MAGPGATAYLVVDGDPAGWALELGRVQSVLHPAAWSGPAPLDLGRALGLQPRAPSSERVLIVRDGGGELPVLARGAVRVEQLAGEALLALPGGLGPLAGTALRAVVMSAARPIFVLGALGEVSP